MCGQRNQGRRSRPAALACAAAAALLLAACLAEEDAAARAPEAAGKALPATADQVVRAAKRDALWRRGSAEAGPDGAAFPLREDNRFAAPLGNFYAALAALHSNSRREPVTILHLGDSHIASDRFTGDLRTHFQARFGDAGRGLLMPGFPFPYYRAQGVRFARQGDWTAETSLTGDPGPYGLTGVKLTAGEAGAWLRLTSEAGAFEWAQATFLTGPGRGTAMVSIDGASHTVATAAATPGLRTVTLRTKGMRLEVRVQGDGPVTVLSWAVGSDRPGVRYVNLGIPGATADITRRWDDRLVGDEMARLAPDLVVLGYGTNEGFDDALDVAAYRDRVVALIARLQETAPTASFLVIGPPDAARFPRFARGGRGLKDLRSAPCRPLSAAERRHYGDRLAASDPVLARWHAPPNLDAVRQALADAAARTGAKFWDWSAVMGGACGIHDWALAEAPLATTDHVHITAAGSAVSAGALFKELMDGFEAQARLASR